MNGLNDPIKRRIRKAPKRACRDDPTPIVEDIAKVTVEIGMMRAKNNVFTKNEPNQTPGQIRYPHSRTAAKAIPEGGHTIVRFPGGMAIKNPSFPVMT